MTICEIGANINRYLNKRQARNIDKKEDVIKDVFVHYYFPNVFLIRSSREFITKSINCKQTSLPLKRRNIYFLLQCRFAL